MGGWARRPALDGLRAVALVLVLLSHGGVGVVGGAIGVDVFLVLSGYLITALLLLELDATGRVDLRAFWARRARRLVPAALVLVAAVALLWRPDPIDAVASLGWWSNWRFALADTGYFDAFGAPSPLRHTWSLAVEEQWYLLWPPLVLVLHRFRCRLVGTIVLALGSAAAMWWLAADVDRVHMGTDTRAQGLLIGAAAAMLLHRRALDALPRVPTTAAGIAGGSFLVAVAWRTPGTDAWLYRGGHLLIAVASAAVVVAAVRPTGPVRAVLAVRPLQAVGRVSYGAYLWHWPLFVWLNPERIDLAPWPLLAVRLAATAAATVVSWRLVESPILDGRPLPRPRLALPTAVAAVVSIVVATAALDPAAHRSAVAAASPTPVRPAGFVGQAASVTVVEPDVLDTAPTPRRRTGDPVVTIAGDSTGLMLGWDVNPVAGIAVNDGASLGCGLDPAGALVGDAVHPEPGVPVPCPQALDLWRWWVAGTDPDVVVLAVGAWEVYDRRLADGSRLDVGTDAWRAWVADSLEQVAGALAEAGPHARIAVTDVPCYDERDLALGGPDSPRNDPARQAAVNAVIHDVVDHHPARLVLLPWSTWLCGSEEFPRDDGVHLTPPVARRLWAGPLGAWVRERAAAAS